MTLADSGDTSTPTRWTLATDLFDRHPELALRSRGWNTEDAHSLLAHLGRGMLQGCPTRDFSAAWVKDPETGKTRPKLHRVGTRSLSRCQYVAMTHPQRSAVLVLDVDVPSHQAGGRIKDINPQVYALLNRWAEVERGPAWVGVNPLSGKCHLIWLIDPVYAAAGGVTSPNTRLLAATTNEMNRLFGGDEAFSHRLSRWPLHVSEDPAAYRWHCQHDRVDRLADLMEIARTMTGTTRPADREPEKQFSSGWERIEAARKASAQARALAELDAGLPSAEEAAGDLIDGVRVLWSAPGRAARDETAFRHALATGHRLRAAGERLKDNKLIDAYERAYNVAQAVGADGREPGLPPVRDRLTMARRVRGYVVAGKSSPETTGTRSSQTTRGRKALATMGRRGGQKAAERWNDPESDYARRQREKLQQAQKRNQLRGQANRASVQAIVGQYYFELNRMPTWRELMDETGMARATIARHLAALREAGMLPEIASD